MVKHTPELELCEPCDWQGIGWAIIRVYAVYSGEMRTVEVFVIGSVCMRRMYGPSVMILGALDTQIPMVVELLSPVPYPSRTVRVTV